MRTVYVCGSFRFVGVMKDVEARLRKGKIRCLMSKSTDAHGIEGCLKKLNEADAVYVVNPEGYVGKSVCLDIGYAYAKKKPIFVMHPIDDPPIMKLVDGTSSPEEMISVMKRETESSHIMSAE